MVRAGRIALASAALLAVWTVLAFTPEVRHLDLAITRWMHAHATWGLDLALSLVSLLGNVEVDAAILLLMGLREARWGDRRATWVLWGLFVLGTLVELVGKHTVPHGAVPRTLRRTGLNPTHHLLSTPYGFPSGHAFRTLYLAGAAWRMLGGRRAAVLRGALIGAVLAAQLALVYLGDHWLSEVVGGDLVAAVCLGLLGALAPA